MDFQDASGIAVEDRARGRRGGGGVLQFFGVFKPGSYVALSSLNDPYVWHEALVTWPSLGVDRAASILTPDDDHYVELMAGANA